MEFRTAQHGTVSMYRHHKCRCDDCRKVWNEKTQEYKLAKKMKRKRGIESIFKGI